MKNTISIIFLVCFFIKSLSAQKIDYIPLTYNENLHSGMLGWIYSANTHEIKVYAYYHKVVNMMELPREQWNKLYGAYKGENKGKQIWEGIKAANSLNPATILVIEELTYDTSLKRTGYAEKEYHTSQLKGDYYRGAMINNSSDPNNKGREEELYEKGVEGIYIDFPLLKKCMQMNVSTSMAYDEKYQNTSEYKGMIEGLYSEGDVQEYNYYSHNFEKVKKLTPIANKPEVNELENVRMVKNFGRSILRDIDDQYIQTWHIINRDDKDDKRGYKCVTFDQEGNVVNSFTYESKLSRDWKFLNLKVFNENGQHCGYLNIFGFDDKAPKEIRGENEALYELVYTTLKGEISLRFEFTNPAKKHYKLFDPFTAIYKNGKFHLSNSRKEGVFKRENELLIIDTSGTVSKGTFRSDKLWQSMQDVIFYMSNSRPDWGFGLDSAVWTVKIASEYIDTKPPYGAFEQRYRKLIFTKYSHETVVDIFSLLLPDTLRRPSIFLLDKQEHQVTYLIKSGGVYYKCTINGLTGQHNIVDATPKLDPMDDSGKPKVPQQNDIQPIHITETNISYIILLFGGDISHLSLAVIMKY
jgi:hypothetical protein